MRSILFGSIVRDGVGYLPRYFEQLRRLHSTYEIGLAICEGDSADETYQYLCSKDTSFLKDYQLFKYDHAGLKYGSVNIPDRWANIAKTWNYMLDHISCYEDYNYFCYMECDLLWDNTTIAYLVEGMNQFDCVAPMSMQGNIFYDTWGHRSRGLHFNNAFPFHPEFLNMQRYMPLESAGSCIMMKTEVAKVSRLASHDAMIGHDIVKRGYSFVLDKQARVNHP